ncbi:N-acetylgalactosamine kinase isoform X2 [Nomia melanderi]|uniref:N-acetylgalactosamine kinase isoform X2 n=1 Tax=Nomia melanderi TaxID=2448451 RepID=UPI0013040274|nr:N-acetylgalactosamine kinase isoform X1 [Nomia melanderi]
MSQCEYVKGDTDPESLVPIFQPDAKIQEKLNILAAHFTKKYDVQPSFIVRVPGRVNLIGEHIDYCGYAVCPMAIEQHILVAVSVSSTSEIRLTNLNPKYKDFQCDIKDLSGCIEDAGEGPVWYKYFLCGVKGALEIILEKGNVPSGILATVWGNIPPNSGLSSSSALVSAALLLTVHAHQRQLSKTVLADISASAERYIGTQGGGMDQAIAFLGKSGSAMLIEFNPVRGTNITLPETAVFVIAHSQACHNKAASSDFNLRVAECRLAAQIIAKKRDKNWESVRKLVDVQKALGLTVAEMVPVVTADLRAEPYTLNEVCEILGTTIERLKEVSSVGAFSESQRFELRQRASHVYQEADRVVKFRRVSEDNGIAEEEKLRQMGSLMSQSHASLQKLYECSHPEVDALVEKAVNCGALGARMTGAGWGGCIVAITTKDKVFQFLDALKKELALDGIKDGFKLDDLVFPTEPNQGAVIYTI